MTNATVSNFDQQALSGADEFLTNDLPPGQEDDLKLTIQRAKELEERYVEEKLPDGFYFSNGWLMFQPESKGEEDPPEPIFIASALSISACTRDEANENHGRLLEFQDVDQHRHEWAMPMELLAGDGARYREELLSKGLLIAPGTKARNLLTFYIQSSKPKARARCAARTGWHNTCFILPDQSIGNSGKERVILQAATSSMPDYSILGDLSGWQKEVAALCVGNSRLIFSLGVAFASPLLHLLGIENGGFHFRGASSTGKTTCLRVAASVWGSQDYIQSWRSTINGLEATASGHNDALLCLDELAQVDSDVAGETAYMLSNGIGKGRANRSGNSQKKAKWRLLILSTGEISLAEHMIEAGKKVRAGQEVRIVDIPADTCTYGVFDNLHGYQNGAAFSQALMLSCNTFHGSPAREFLRLLIENREEAVLLVNGFNESFMRNFVPSGADGQVLRVGRRFALAAAAGELATAFGITGLSKGASLEACKACFYEWLGSRGGTGPQEESAILSQVRRFFEQHAESRFSPWEAEDDNKTVNRVGFRKRADSGELEFFAFPEVFKSEISKGFDHKLVAKTCLKNGILVPGSNGEPSRSERLPGRTQNARCYRFTSKVLGDDEVKNAV